MADAFETTPAEYERSVWQDVRDNPAFEAGMLVIVHWKTGDYYGRVVRHACFSEFWLMHKYDVKFLDGDVKEFVFECDMERVCGFQPRVVR